MDDISNFVERAKASMNGPPPYLTFDDGWTLVSPVPPDAPKLQVAANIDGEWRQPDFSWRYTDAERYVFGYACRWNKADGDKHYSFATFWRRTDGKECWRLKHLPAPRPLLNLYELLAARPNDPVLVVEGEKAARAAHGIFRHMVVTTSIGGASNASHADWSPLARRNVTIWPDADDPGATYAQDVTRLAYDSGAHSIAIVNVATMPPKWDLADVVPNNADIHLMLANAVPWRRKAKAETAGLKSKSEKLFVSWGDFEMSEDGLIKRSTKPSTHGEWIAAPFEVLGASRDPSGCSWGKWLRWQDNDKRVHSRHIADARLHGDPSVLCAALADEGLTISRAQQRAFVTYLGIVPTEGRVTVVHRTGWHDITDHGITHSAFVLPTETIGPKGGGAVILDGSAKGPYEARGSLEDWQNGVGTLSVGHALAVLAISSALAGPLLSLARQEGGGVHFCGQSSKGKTTLLQMAASVWGRGDSSSGFVRAWRATANGLEGAAAGASDTALILDELGQVEAREAGAALYSLSNGGGKVRAGRDGGLREPKSWRVMFISTGEVPTEAKLAEDRGRKPRTGQSIRLLDIPAERGFGVFDHAGRDGDAAALAKACKLAAVSAYGTAGPEFVRRIIDQDVTGEVVRALIADFTSAHVPAGADGQIDRAAHRLGLIAAAGELATLLGVTPWKKGEARAAAAWALEQWIAGRGGTAPAEVRQAIEQVRLFIESHGESRFQSLDDPNAKPVSNRLGWRKGGEWWIPSQVWKAEICNGFDPKFVAHVLAENGMLRRQGGNVLQCTVNIGGGNRVRAYVLTANILDGGDDPR
jgi:uncharacterized protein (DUF927 family)